MDKRNADGSLNCVFPSALEMSSMIASPIYRYLLLLTCLLRDLMLVVTAECSADGISVYSGVQSVFPSRFRGG